MADSILRLRVDSQEYDNKLKRAAEGLQRYADGCRKAGGTLEHLDDGVLEFTKALGNMEAVSKSAKGSINEMTKTFTELSVVYNRLTDEEKAAPFGKALADSLNTLKGRIQEGNGELKNISSSLNDTGGFLDQLKDKFVVNIDALKLFQMGLSTAKAALDVAKDAFFNNEQQLDEWGRIVESSEGLYKGFLTALNTGDISGYLQNIDNITKAARAAYDALDALNTFNAFNQINVEKTRTAMTESIADYRGGTGSKEEVKAAGEAYKKELQERKKLEKEAYIEAVGEVAAQRGVSKEDLLTALSGTYGSYQQLKNMPMSGTQTVIYGGGMFGGGGSYQKEVPNSIQEKLGDALRRLNDDELKNLQALGAQAERTGNEIATVDKQLTRVLNGRGGAGGSGAGGSGGGGGRSGGGSNTNVPTYAADSISAQTALVSELSKKWNEAGESMRDSYLYELIQAENKLKDMKDAQSTLRNQQQAKNSMKVVSPELSAGLADSLGIMPTLESIQQQLDANPLIIHVETTEKDIRATAESAKYAAAAVSSIGQAFNSIEDPAAKVAGIVAQAIATVASAYAQALSTDWSTKSNIWAFIAAAAASTASMVTTISQIHSATGYAQGGMIKGNSYSGDNIGGLVDGSQLVGLDAGEIVLNKAQQSNVASGLQGAGGLGNLRLSTRLSGSDLILSIERTGQIKGYGQLMFWKGN